MVEPDGSCVTNLGVGVRLECGLDDDDSRRAAGWLGGLGTVDLEAGRVGVVGV